MLIVTKLREIKRKLSYKKVLLKNYLIYRKTKTEIEQNIKADVALFGTPAYGNMGDQLIALAEREFLKFYYKKAKIIEITENDIRYRINMVKKIIDNHTILYLQGGGNISDVWEDQEKIREKIIKNFSNNKIIVMPQTAFFSNATVADTILDKYKKIRKVCAREVNTYNLLLEHEINTYLCPDIALFLIEYCKKFRKVHKRANIGICMRTDRESIFGGVSDIILEHLKKNELQGENFSTVIEGYITPERREEEVCKILKYISEKELIITDRLHAMIMAYLTDTPCIAYANSNNKVGGTYEFIRNATNIYYSQDIEDGLVHISDVMGKSNTELFAHDEKYSEIIDLL